MQTIKTTKPSQLVKVFQKKTLKLLKVNKDFLGKGDFWPSCVILYIGSLCSLDLYLA